MALAGAAKPIATRSFHASWRVMFHCETSPSVAVGLSLGGPVHHPFRSRDQIGRLDLEHLSDSQQNYDVRALDAAFDQADKRPVQAGGFCKLLLRHFLSLPQFPENLAKGPFGAAGGLQLRMLLNLSTGGQVNMLRRFAI
jgi:hypothetical protein